MAAVMADTHAVVWYEQGSSRLSAAALGALRATVQGGDPIRVSAVSLVEIAYLVEKNRLPPDAFDRILTVLRRPNSDLVEVPFDSYMAESLRLIPVGLVPDMPDRMIAATALHLKLPLVTADQKIRAVPSLTTIW